MEDLANTFYFSFQQKGSWGLSTLTEANAAVLQKVVEVVEHGALILPTDATEVAEKPTAARHHPRKPDLLEKSYDKKCQRNTVIQFLLGVMILHDAGKMKDTKDI